MSAQRPRPLIPDWVVAVATLVTGLLVVFNVAYQLGAGGMRVGGSSMSFDRQFDDTVYRLSDAYGFEVDDHAFRIVEIRRGIPPINPVCGVWDARAIVMSNPAFIQDGVILSEEYYEWETPGGIDLATGEFLSVEQLVARGLPTPRPWVNPSRNPNGAIPPTAAPDAAKPDGDHPVIPAKPPRDGAAAALAAPSTPTAATPPSTAARLPLDRAYVTAEFDRLRVINESCIVFNAAFVAIYLLLAIITIPVAITRIIRRRRSS